ncbi:Asic5 [Columba guinea]|nr:Asic5 [Columba guinea]
MLEKMRLCLTEKLLPHLEDRRKYHQEFASSTSFHGVHNIVQTRSKTRKVLWLLVVTGCLTIVIWQICSRFMYYFSWPTTTTVVVQYVENVKFPAVTFCNLNRFQAHAVSNLKIIFLIWNIVSGAQHKSHVEEKYSQELHDFLLGNQNFSIKEFTRKNGFYLNSSTLLKCDFFGKPCNPQAILDRGFCMTRLRSFVLEIKNIESQGNGTECDLLKFYNCVYPAVLIQYAFVIRKNLVCIDIKYNDLSYKITQQQKALTISELIGK